MALARWRVMASSRSRSSSVISTGECGRTVDLAQHAHLHLDGDGDHGFKPCIAAVRQGDLGGWRDGDDPVRRSCGWPHRQLPCAGMLALGHGHRQAVAGQQHVALIGLVGPAHGGGIGPATRRICCKTLGQRLQAAGGAGQRTDLVQGGQPLVLHGDAGGLLLDLVFQVIVRRLQRMRHEVENPPSWPNSSSVSTGSRVPSSPWRSRAWACCRRATGLITSR